MTALRRATNHTAANGAGSQFHHGRNSRHCLRCNKWRPQAGGAISKRTQQWVCACCKPLNLQG